MKIVKSLKVLSINQDQGSSQHTFSSLVTCTLSLIDCKNTEVNMNIHMKVLIQAVKNLIIQATYVVD